MLLLIERTHKFNKISTPFSLAWLFPAPAEAGPVLAEAAPGVLGQEWDTGHQGHHQGHQGHRARALHELGEAAVLLQIRDSRWQHMFASPVSIFLKNSALQSVILFHKKG